MVVHSTSVYKCPVVTEQLMVICLRGVRGAADSGTRSPLGARWGTLLIISIWSIRSNSDSTRHYLT